jgi:hypothetical protein
MSEEKDPKGPVKSYKSPEELAKKHGRSCNIAHGFDLLVAIGNMLDRTGRNDGDRDGKHHVTEGVIGCMGA